MGRDSELKFILTGDSRRLQSTMRQGERHISSSVKRIGRMYTGLSRRISTGLKRSLINPFTGLASGAGIAILGKQIIDFDAALVRVGNQGNLASKELMRMRQEIIETGIATGQTRDDVLSGIDAIVQRTGDLSFANKIKSDMAIASTATGAAMEDMGALASNLNRQFGILDTQVMSAFNTLVVQGKAGAFTLRDMAAMGERLFAAAGRLGMKGADDLKRFGGLIQMARMGTGSSEQATTAIERILSNIIAKQTQIRKLGFNVFENESEQKFKSIDSIIKGVIIAAKGNEKTLGGLFGEEGIRGISTLAKLYRETGGFDLYDNLVNADAQRAGELMKDFTRYSETASNKFKVLGEIGKKFADKALARPISEITNALDQILKNPAAIDNMTQKFEDLGLVITTVAKGLMLSAKGWAEIIRLVNAGASNVSSRSEIDKEFWSLPSAAQKRFKKKYGISNFGDWDEKSRAISEYRDAIKIQNNITINQASDGRIIGVKSDNLNTENNVRSNRGHHTARQ